MDAASIISAVTSVTKAWTKQRKAEERGSRRQRVYYYSDRVNFTDIAEEILPTAYLHASGQGAYTVSQRQLYYAARDAFKEATDREIDYSYFSQTILRQYLNRNNVDWKITADARGTFSIPNAAFEKRIPVGTIQIDKYIENDRGEIDDDVHTSIPIQWPSMAEGQRYAAVLYIEKEGFEPLLQEAKIAERYDLAILSCKGQSVVAARKLVDNVCAKNGGVPLFVVHDFDKAGFEIAECLTKVSLAAEYTDRVAYRFENEIDVTDFGLRLVDVEKYGLASEKCKGNRGTSAMTKAEREFLQSGRRVELNAFTAPQFIEWLEAKLKTHLPQRLIPDDDAILEQAYRRALAVSSINAQLENIRSEALEMASIADIPKALRKKIRAAMKKSEQPWDIALHAIAEELGGAQ
jgi:DNA topoisomerase VI subunit A